MTNAVAVPDLARSILGRLDEALETRTLAPFGDGPFELQLAVELNAELPAQQLDEVLDYASRLSWSEVIDPAADVAAFRRFASLSFVLRFCDRSPDPGLASAAVHLLVGKAREDREARFALADFIRTLARTGADVSNVENYPYDTEADDPDFLSAIAELLVTQGVPVGVELIGGLIARGVDVSSLLWNLAQERVFPDLLQQTPFDLRVSVRSQLELALLDMDPSGDALAAWQDLAFELTSDEPDWAMLDYRYVATAA
jgi:hypothetical protein